MTTKHQKQEVTAGELITLAETAAIIGTVTKRTTTFIGRAWLSLDGHDTTL